MDAPGPQRPSRRPFQSPVNYYGTVSLGGLIPARNPVKYHGRMFIFPTALYPSHITPRAGGGRQQLPWPPAFSVPVYLIPYHLRNGAFVSPSPSLLTDHKRHRNSVAKYLDDLLTCLMEDLNHTKSAEKTR